MQSIALSDSALRQRVRRHVELLAQAATIAESTPASGAALVPTARRHANAVIEALDAHCNDAALPSYQPLPLNDAAGLIGWQPVPTPKRGKDAAVGTNDGTQAVGPPSGASSTANFRVFPRSARRSCRWPR